MPVISERVLNCSVYFYSSTDDARSGTRTGGCGFIVGFPRPDQGWHLYVVTNKHVIDAGFRTLRVNTTDGTSKAINTAPEDWTSVFDDDVAVMPMQFPAPFKVGVIPVDMFLPKDNQGVKSLDVGDDAVLIGRLITHEGRQRNKPIARFGSIAMMADDGEPVNVNGKPQVAFLVDCRSLSGSSGSAVLGFRVSQRGGMMIMGPSDTVFLGIDCAHLPFWTQVRDAPNGNKIPGSWVESNSGIAVVIPAWRILNVLNQDSLLAKRTGEDKQPPDA